MTVDEIKQKLKEMAEVDQKVRSTDPIDFEEMAIVDRANTEVLNQIVKQYGWPTISMFDKETVGHAWLLAQHASHNPELQASFLEAISQLPTSEISKKKLAYLEDTVMLKRDNVQKYGTQLIKPEGKSYFVLLPLIDKNRLDEWRLEAGLMPIREYLNYEYFQNNGGAYIDDEDFAQQTAIEQTA